MRVFKIASLALGIIFLLLLTACSQEEKEPVTEKTGVVTSTQAYLDHFGEPPQGKAGRAYARVGYLPLKDNPQKVRPFPLFLFSDKNQLRQMLTRLTSGELRLPEDFGLYNPFPGDVELTTTPLSEPVVTVSLKSQISWPDADKAAAGLALAETVFQFPEVKRVLVMLNGQSLPGMPEEGYQRRAQQVAEVAPPNLVLIAGMWGKGSDHLDELLVEFDRPIKVNDFKLFDETGKKVEGEYYTSIFQMAVVILPKTPDAFDPGMTLRAEWDVVDFLGRSNRGSNSMPIQRLEH
jgi:hypothetical protein